MKINFKNHGLNNIKLNFRIIILSVLVSLIFSFFTSIEFLLNFSNDDSFFYIKTAYNFSSGYGSTFDTINATNGYHPLWFLMLSAYYFLLNLFVSFSPELFFRFTVLLICLICIATEIIIFKYFKIINPSNYLKQFYLSVPLFFTLVVIRDFGMETHVLCLLITAYLYFKSDELMTQKSRLKTKLFLLVFIFLTRIDFLMNVIPIIILADYLTSPAEAGKKYLIYSLITVFCTAFAYFTSNYIFFGNFSTITAKIKNSFPEIIFYKNFTDLFAPGTFTNQFVKSFYVAVTVIIFLLINLKKSFRDKFSKSDYFLFGLCISSLVFIISNLFFNHYTLKEWYVAFPAFICSLLMIRMINLFPRVYVFSLILFISVFIYYFIRTRIENYKWDSMYYYALDLKNNTNENDRIFMIDLSGIVGYFSERKIINGDGLVNNFEYWKYKTEGKIGDYLKENKVKYYSTYSTGKGNHEMRDSSGYLIDMCYSNKFGGYAYTFPREDLVLKSPYYYSHAVNSDKGFWYLFKLR